MSGIDDWKEAVRVALEGLEDDGIGMATPGGDDAIGLCVAEDLIFYDCSGPSTRMVLDEPSPRKVRGWLWRIRQDPVWSAGRPAFMLVREDGRVRCAVGKLVPRAMSAVLDRSLTVEFTRRSAGP